VSDSLLCRIGFDDCGDELQCIAFPSALPTGVGRCIDLQGG
jgi:hypothetical protein